MEMVSIIVPVYNVAPFLENCLNRLLQQTYQNIEIILVNDGSTDKSGAICERYAKNDARIKVIHQANLGPSAARNAGIYAAKGKYLQFVDADDDIEQTMTQCLVEAMTEEAELVICGFRLIYSLGSKTYLRDIQPSLSGIYEKSAFFSLFGELYEKSLLHSCCNKLYVTELMKTHHIRFIDCLSLGEDLLFNVDYFKICHRFSIICDVLYHYYNTNVHSITNGFRQNSSKIQRFIFDKVREFLVHENGYVGANKEAVDTFYIKGMIMSIEDLFHQQCPLSAKEIRGEIRQIICDAELREYLHDFQGETIQHRFIRYLMKRRFVHGIYWFFKLKYLMKYKSSKLFRLCQHLNQRSISCKHLLH